MSDEAEKRPAFKKEPRIEIDGQSLGDALTQAGYLDQAALIQADKRYVVVKLP